jgi:hypothetical protein
MAHKIPYKVFEEPKKLTKVCISVVAKVSLPKRVTILYRYWFFLLCRLEFGSVSQSDQHGQDLYLKISGCHRIMEHRKQINNQ